MKILFCLFISIYLSGCFHENKKSQSSTDSQGTEFLSSSIKGISGMANFDDNKFLVVHDAKNNEKEKSLQRISVIQLNNGESYTKKTVTVKKWNHRDEQSSDLEAVCALPGRNNEFLLLESGRWAGKFGRMFYIKLDLSNTTYGAQILHTFELPEFDEDDQLEGLACMKKSENTYLVILGERGGSKAYEKGLLRWTFIDFNSSEIKDHLSSDLPLARQGLEVNAPGSWHNSKTNRDISALYLDGNTLWAAASEEIEEDKGPFNSIIYQVGTVDASNEQQPITLNSCPAVYRQIGGYKVEGLASPPKSVKFSLFSIGTEDEGYGGTWRTLSGQ